MSNSDRAGIRAELWDALGESGLRELFADLSSRVYADRRLRPYFRHLPRDVVFEKQVVFFRELLVSGTHSVDLRAVHCWMQISSELFDYRQELMTACLERQGLTPDLVAEWLSFEAQFRAEVVDESGATSGVRRVPDDFRDFGIVVRDASVTCDTCSDEIPAGVALHFHEASGQSCCTACSGVDTE